MCGRFVLTLTWIVLRDRMNLLQDDPPPGLFPRYNIAPTQVALIIRADRDTNDRTAAMLRWGLAPRWSKQAERGPINARIETAADKPMFRDAMKHRRCIIPASGFYEWQAHAPGKAKQPWYITPAPDPGASAPDEACFAFAGLWESHPEIGHTFCILTTEPNELMRPIHDRMPVILAPAQFDEWLSSDPVRFDPAVPFPAEFMDARRVSSRVNKPANDDPSLIAPDDDQLF